MPDTTYNPQVYIKQGGQQLVVASGGSILVETGGSILPNSGTKPAKITFTSSANMSAAQITKINGICSILIGAGMMATS